MSGSKFIYEETLKFCKDNDENRIISSSLCIGKPCCIGIDEAGRGPVLGPMVYAGAYVELEKLNTISEIGLDDSKKLKEETREKLLKDLADEYEQTVGFDIEIISPNYISTNMLNIYKNNLNNISHDAAINIIRRIIGKGVNVHEVYLDTVGPADKYKSLIQDEFPGLKVVVESKADSTYPIVSAASIFAKVTRDRCIAMWKHRERHINVLSSDDNDTNWGSGYPSDPKTKEYLRNIIDPVFGFPQFVRSSWATASSIMDKECIKMQWADDEIQTNIHEGKSENRKRQHSSKSSTDKGNQSITEFTKPELPFGKRHYFFCSRKLERVKEF